MVLGGVTLLSDTKVETANVMECFHLKGKRKGATSYLPGSRRPTGGKEK